MKKTSNTTLRVITSVMIAILFIACLCTDIFSDYLFHGDVFATRWLLVAIMTGAIIEMIVCMFRLSRENFKRNKLLYFGFLAWLFLMLASAFFVGKRFDIIILALLIIAGADIGGWLFGKYFGGDKMWERISANKTWAGQIGGILCGTFMGILFGFAVADQFEPFLMWTGFSMSLLSQYGDLTASYIKRKMGIKDFSHILPGHGGILDRFDGWIYILPLLWLVLNS